LEGVLLLIKGMREWSGRMASFIEADGGYYLDSFVKQPWFCDFFDCFFSGICLQ
jgi:hypothetical protein